jgi:hypothetical protein
VRCDNFDDVLRVRFLVLISSFLFHRVVLIEVRRCTRIIDSLCRVLPTAEDHAQSVVAGIVEITRDTIDRTALYAIADLCMRHTIWKNVTRYADCCRERKNVGGGQSAVGTQDVKSEKPLGD